MKAWEKFVEQQKERLGSANADQWLLSLKVIHFDAGNLYLEAQDPFHALWFEEHIRPIARKELCNSRGLPLKIHLTIAHETPSSTKKKNTSKTLIQPISILPDPLDPWATFSHFLPTPDNALAVRLLQHPTEYNPIYLYGPEGAGKTHLLMAAAAALIEKGAKTFFVRLENFTEHVVNAIRSGNMKNFRNAYRSVDALIIDDVHLLARRMATQEELFHTFNALHTLKKTILLSGNTAPQKLSDIEPRLTSRFEWGITLALQPLPSPLLKPLLEERLRFQKVTLSEEIQIFLLTEFSTCQSLIRATDLLLLRSHLENRDLGKLALEQVHLFLAPLLKEKKEPRLSPEMIVPIVAKYYGIRVQDILGKAQTRECAFPRQVAMYLCRTTLRLSYPKIGEIFGRDHSTVMSSVKQIERELEGQEKILSTSLAEIRASLNL